MDIATKVSEELGRFTRGNGVTTGTVRKLSAKLFRELEDKNIDSVFALCDTMLKERKWALGVIAYDWAYRVRKQYDENTFAVFDRWVKDYIRHWGPCDDLCTHALGYLIAKDNSLFEKTFIWMKHSEHAVRRAAPVSLIYPITHDEYSDIDPFIISNALMQDTHYLVQKGYGWMLKVLSQKEPQKVIEYLIKNKDAMPRTAYRYALEKLNKETKNKLMAK